MSRAGSVVTTTTSYEYVGSRVQTIRPNPRQSLLRLDMGLLGLGVLQMRAQLRLGRVAFLAACAMPIVVCTGMLSSCAHAPTSTASVTSTRSMPGGAYSSLKLIGSSGSETFVTGTDSSVEVTVAAQAALPRVIPKLTFGWGSWDTLKSPPKATTQNVRIIRIVPRVKPRESVFTSGASDWSDLRPTGEYLVVVGRADGAHAVFALGPDNAVRRWACVPDPGNYSDLPSVIAAANAEHDADLAVVGGGFDGRLLIWLVGRDNAGRVWVAAFGPPPPPGGQSVPDDAGVIARMDQIRNAATETGDCWADPVDFVGQRFAAPMILFVQRHEYVVTLTTLAEQLECETRCFFASHVRLIVPEFLRGGFDCPLNIVKSIQPPFVPGGFGVREHETPK